MKLNFRLTVLLILAACGGRTSPPPVEVKASAIKVASTTRVRYHASPDPRLHDADVVLEGDQFWTSSPASTPHARAHFDATGGAWEVDTRAGASIEESWTAKLARRDAKLGLAEGWTLTALVRLPTANDSVDAGAAASYSDTQTVWSLTFGTDTTGVPRVGVAGYTGSFPVTTPGIDGFHKYELVFAPGAPSPTVVLKVDGVEIASGFTGVNRSGLPAVAFGDGTSGAAGHIQYRRVEWKTNGPSSRRVSYVASPNPAIVGSGLTQADRQAWEPWGNASRASVLVDGADVVWDVNSPGGGAEEAWLAPVSVAKATLARASGWTLRTRLRIPGEQAVGPGTAVSFADGHKLWRIDFGADAVGNTIAQVVGASSHTLTSGGFHTFELVYEPTTQTAALSADGTVIISGIAGDTLHSAPVLMFGDLTTSNGGRGQFQSVEWGTDIEAPSAPPCPAPRCEDVRNSTAVTRLRYEFRAEPTEVDGNLTAAGFQPWISTLNGSPNGVRRGRPTYQGSSAAWELDTLDSPAVEEYWSLRPTAQDRSTGNSDGWTLRTRLNMPTPGDNRDTGAAVGYDDGGNRYFLVLGTTAAGDAQVSIAGDNREPVVVGKGYHTYELRFDTSDSRVDLYVDGQPTALTNSAGHNVSSGQVFLQFGDLTSGAGGHAEYQRVEWFTRGADVRRVLYQVTGDPSATDADVFRDDDQLWQQIATGGTSPGQLVQFANGGAWDVRSTGASMNLANYWYQTPSAADLATSTLEGWLLTARVRVPGANDLVGSGTSVVFADGTRIWALRFGSNATGATLLGISGDPRPEITVAGGGFHQYELRYDATSGTAALLVDGNIVRDQITGDSQGMAPGVYFGDMADGYGDNGHGQFQLVSWSVQPPDPPEPPCASTFCRDAYSDSYLTRSRFDTTPNPARVDGQPETPGVQPWLRVLTGASTARPVAASIGLSWDVNTMGLTSQREYWQQTPLLSDVMTGRTQGWTLTGTVRTPAMNDAVDEGAIIEFADGDLLWQLRFGTIGGQPHVSFGTGAAIPISETGEPRQFHTYQLHFDPATGTAQLMIGEEELIGGLQGTSLNSLGLENAPANERRFVRFGDRSTSATSVGHAQYRWVEWRTNGSAGPRHVRYLPDLDPQLSDASPVVAGHQPWSRVSTFTSVAGPVSFVSNAAWEQNSYQRGVTSSYEEYWRQTPTTEDLTIAKYAGWSLRAKLRLPQRSDPAGGGAAVAFHDGQRAWIMRFGTEAMMGFPMIQVLGGEPPAFASGTGFHEFELRYDPGTQRATLFIDRQAVPYTFAGYAYASAPMIYFGDGAGGDQGHAQFQSVDWSLRDGATDSPIDAVVPLVSCVIDHGSTYTAIFGYRNGNPTAVNLPPAAGSNFVEPSPLDRGQPGWFKPATATSQIHPVAFGVNLAASATAKWTIGSRSALATRTAAPACSYASTGTDGPTVTVGNSAYPVPGCGVQTCQTGLCPIPNACNSAPPGEPPPGPSIPVGAEFNGVLRGNLSVSPTGAAIYTVPISTPPGVAGMAPNLSLVYNSQGGNGIAGQGWELGGVSMIYRCPKTRVQDGQAEPVDLSAEDGGGLCLDGQRLFRRSEDSYYLESEPFTTVETLGPPDGYPNTFTITTKSGERRFYGARGPLGEGYLQVRSQQPTGPIVVWLLGRVSDAWGNYFDLHYNNGNGNQASDESFLASGIRPTRIDYTGYNKLPGYEGPNPPPLESQSPFWSVELAYQPRNDIRVIKFGHISIPKKDRLKSIKVIPFQQQNSPAHRTYTLDYLPDDETRMLPSRLKSIGYCASDGINSRCLKSLDFDWDGGDFGWDAAPGYSIHERIDRRGGGNRSWGSQFVDLDADGRPDFIVRRSDRSVALRNTGTGFAPAPNAWLAPRVLVGSDGGEFWSLFADMNNDGLVDFVSNPGVTVGERGPQIWLNRIRASQGWERVTFPAAEEILSQWSDLDFANTARYALRDMNGDGRADIVKFPDPARELIQVWWNLPGDTPATSGRWQQAPDHFYDMLDEEGNDFGTIRDCVIRDVNRDDLPDVVCTNTVGINVGPEGIGGRAWKTNSFPFGGLEDPRVALEVRSFGDIDGDGYHDWVDIHPYKGHFNVPGADGPCLYAELKPRSVSLSTGGWAGIASGSHLQALNDFLPPASLDFSSGPNPHCPPPSPEGPSPTRPIPTTSLRRNHLLALADFNSDGLADLVLNHDTNASTPDPMAGGQLLVNTGETWRDYDGRAGRLKDLPDTSADFPPIRVPAVPADGDSVGYAGQESRTAMYLDLNGDSVSDVIEVWVDEDGEVQNNAWLNTFKPPVISHFSNGLAIKTEVIYVYISHKDATAEIDRVYTDNNTLAPGTAYLAAPLRVVKLVRGEDGSASGLSTRTTYDYQDLRNSSTGRGPQGFREVSAYDEASGTLTRTTYAQAYPYTGRAISVTKVRRGLTLSETTTSYCDATIPISSYPQCTPNLPAPTCTSHTGPAGGGAYPRPDRSIFVYPRAVTDVAYLWDGDVVGSTSRQVTTATSYRYDQQGNPICTVVAMTAPGEEQRKIVDSRYGEIGSIHSSRGLATRSVVTTQRLLPADGNNTPKTHTTEFDYDTTLEMGPGPAPKPVPLIKKKVEPGRGFPLEFHTAYGHDARGNVTTTTECQDQFAPTTCFAGASNPAGSENFPQGAPFRTSEVSYNPAHFNSPTAAGGVESTLRYNQPGRFPVRTKNAAGHLEYVAYDPWQGTVVQRTGVDGVHACYRYDSLGRQTQEVLRCGSAKAASTTVTYRVSPEPGSAVVTVTQPATGAWTWTYSDVLGRPIKVRVRGFSNEIIESFSKRYDQEGKLFRETKPRVEGQASFAMLPIYDGLGRVESTTHELGIIDGGTTPAQEVVTYAYAGSKITTERTVAGVGQTREETKDVAGKVVSVIEAGQETEFEYDADGNLTTAGPKTWLQNRIVTEYDDRGRKTKTIDPNMGTWTYTYNGFGELMSQTDAKGQVIEMRYDTLGRMISKAVAGEAATWIYDSPGGGIGKLSAMVSAPDPGLAGECTIPGTTSTAKRAVRSFKYTALGHVEEVSECVDGTTFQTDFEYDNFGRQSTVTYPQVRGSRLKVSNRYTATGYLHYISDVGDGLVYWAAKTMNARGQVTEEFTRNGVTTVATRNASTGWLLGSTSTAQLDGGRAIQRWGYSFDEAGNLKSRTRSDDVVAENSTETFVYDDLNRLVTSTTRVGTYVAADGYSYDGTGNITFKGNSMYAYTGCMAGNRPAGPHAVCSVSASGNSQTYSYDHNGNMISGAGRSVSYNAFNKPVRFEQPGTTVGFIYGADGDRVVQQVDGADPARTIYVGLGATGKSLYERTTRGSTTEHVQFLYAAANHSGNAFALRVTIDGPTSSAPEMKYQSFDHLGSVTAVSDARGRVIGSTGGSWASSGVMGYDAWGARRNPDGRPAGTVPFDTKPGRRGFTGHESITGIGLINMNGRVYDPTLGRFLSPDPVVQFETNLQSHNRYSYVLNNPLSYTDPTGYISEGVFSQIGIGLFVAVGGGLCVASGGTGCGVVFAVAGSMLNAAAAISRGASVGSVVGSTAIGLFSSAVGGAVTAGLGSSVAAEMIRGQVSGAIAGAMSTVAFGGNLGANIVDGAMASAISAGFSAAVSSVIVSVANRYGGAHGLSPEDLGLPNPGKKLGRVDKTYSIPGSEIPLEIVGAKSLEQADSVAKLAHEILATRTGRWAMSEFDGNAYRIRLGDGSSYSIGNGMIYLNPDRRYFILFQKMDGGMKGIGLASVQRTIAHETGHALLNVADQDGFKNMSNVHIENRIMRELGSRVLRIQYEKPDTGTYSVFRDPSGGIARF